MYKSVSIARYLYRGLNILVLAGLFVSAGTALVVKMNGYHLTERQASVMRWPLFVCVFWGSLFLTRFPDAPLSPTTVREYWQHRFFWLRWSLSWIPGGYLLAIYQEELQTDPFKAVVTVGIFSFIWGYLLYHRALSDGVIRRPAFAYWAAISLVDWLTLGASVRTGGWASIGSLQLLCWSLGATSVLVVLVCSQRRGDLSYRVSRFDLLTMLGSGVALLVWMLSGMPELALLALAIAMSVAVLPLVVSSAKGNEASLALAPFALGGVAGLFLVKDWQSWTDWLIPSIGASSFGCAFLLAVVHHLRSRPDS